MDAGQSDDEESLVVVELSGLMQHDWETEMGTTCRILGLNTQSPYLQIGRYTFHGEYTDALGTQVLFEKLESDELNDEGEPKKELKLIGHTHKVLNMERVMMKQKTTGDPSLEEATDDPDKHTESAANSNLDDTVTESTQSPMDTSQSDVT